MTLSIDDHHCDVSRRARLPAGSNKAASKVRRPDDPWACQVDGQVTDLRRRIPTLRRLIADCDRLVAELDQDIRNEENRVNVHNPRVVAYSTYAKATASRRDNLKRSADELRVHLAKAERALRDLGGATLDA
jgi:hypothetical protein